MKKIFTLLVMLISLMLSMSLVNANEVEPRGIYLEESAFGIPAEQLNFNNQTPFTFSFWVNIKEFNHNTQGTQFLNIRNPNINDNMDKGGGYPLCDWGYLFSTIQEYGVDDYGGIWKDNELLVSVREQTASSSSPFVREKTFKFSSGKWFFVTFQIAHLSDSGLLKQPRDK